MSSLVRAALMAAVACSQLAVADPAGFQPNVTIISDEIIYDVNADGTSTMDETMSLRVNTDQGVKTRSQFPLSFSTTLQTLEVLEAYTTTKDGKRIDVTPDKILLQQSPQSTGAPMFDDAKVKNVVFPGVEIGSTLSIHFRRSQVTPLFPGQFSILDVSSTDNEHKSTSVTVRAPESLKLYVDAVDMKGGQVAPDKPGTQLWRWSIENVPAHARETGSVGAIDRSPRVAVTTFPSYEAAGIAYLARAKPKAAATPVIKKLADEITRGVTGKREQADALYRWVSTNIRYVAIFLNFGSVVPHEAEAIVEARYGDCKDHVTLLEALLAAKGIKSSPVLVNATDNYWLPKVAVTPGVFNHVISYLPEFDLFLDSTPGVAMFGALPYSEQGKSALVADDGTGKPKIVILPRNNPEIDRVNITTKLDVNADGTVTGTSEVNNAGVFDIVTRQLFASLPPGTEAQVANRVLALSGQHGTGKYTHSEVRDLGLPFTYSSQFQLPDYAQFPGPGAMAVPRGLSSFSGIRESLEQFSPEKRELPMIVVGRRVSEKVVISLPEGVRVATLPNPAKVSSPFITYESGYSAEGRTITVKRELEIKVAGAIVRPDEYQAFRSMALSVLKDLRAQLVY